MHRGDSRFYLGRYPSRGQQEGAQWGRPFENNRGRRKIDERQLNRWADKAHRQTQDESAEHREKDSPGAKPS